MKAEDFMEEVLTPEQMQVLKHKCIDISDGRFYWVRKVTDFTGEVIPDPKWSFSISDKLASMNFESYEVIPTYTINDIIKKISYSNTSIIIENPRRNIYKLTWVTKEWFGEDHRIEVKSHNLITAYYKLYMDLLDRHLI